MEALNGLHSPQLRQLAQRLHNGNATALTHFWHNITQQGTPLVEPLDNQQSLLTLLWRDTKDQPADLRCCLGGILNSRSMAHQLHHLADSDLWYKSYRLPNDISATYHFFINGLPTSDPLSRHTFTIPADDVSPFGERAMRLAIVELPNALPQSWHQLHPETPQGQLTSQLLPSTIVGHDYRLSIYTPHNYSRNAEPYPLLLYFDAWTYTQVIPTSTIFDNLIAANRLPPLITVLFGHIKREERMHEMAFYQPFFQCIMQELLPYIQKHYHITADSTKTIIGGSSMGGIAALYTALLYPERFGNIISHSGSFQAGPPHDKAYQRIEHLLSTHPTRHSQHIYLDVGQLERDEMGFGMPDGSPNALTSNRAMHTLLQTKGYPITYHEYPGGHDLLWAAPTLVAALQALASNL